MSELTTGIVALFLLLLFFLTGIELAFAMAVMGFVGFAYLVNFSAASNLLVKDFFDTFTSYGFTVIPLFVLMGQVASNSDVAKRLYHAAHKFVGHIPGGLAMTTVVGATLFKAMCGSTLATAATFAGIAIPEMDRYGYDKRLSTGVVASVGTLGMLIPPSIVLIIYGIVVEQSIGRLFLAGILPGLLIALFFLFIIYGWVKINPAIAPRAEKVALPERLRALPEFIVGRGHFLYHHRRAHVRGFQPHRGRHHGHDRGFLPGRDPEGALLSQSHSILRRLPAHRLHDPLADLSAPWSSAIFWPLPRSPSRRPTGSRACPCTGR